MFTAAARRLATTTTRTCARTTSSASHAPVLASGFSTNVDNNSTDGYFDKYAINHAAESSADLTGRTQHYALLGGARALYASAARLGAIKFVSSMAAAADAVALSTVEVNIGALPVGQSLTVKWRGKPIFVRHRTAAEIAQAAVDDAAELRDPQTDADRVKPGQSEWLVVVGVCTHLGCVPVGDAGDYNGWFCPCHGSHYDTSGRIRKGPAPLNLEVPTYSFSDPKTLIVG